MTSQHTLNCTICVFDTDIRYQLDFTAIRCVRGFTFNCSLNYQFDCIGLSMFDLDSLLIDLIIESNFVSIAA